MTLEGSNFHQMVPNLKLNGIISIKTYKYGLWIIYIIFVPLKTCLGLMTKIPKLLGNCVQIPPRVMAKLALQIKYDPPKFQNRVWE